MGNNNSSQSSDRKLYEVINELERKRVETEIYKKKCKELIQQEEDRVRARARAQAQEELSHRKSMKEEIKKEVLKSLENKTTAITQPSAPPIALVEAEHNIPNPNFNLRTRQHEILVQKAAPSYPTQAPYNPYEHPTTSIYPQIPTTSKIESSSVSALKPAVGFTNQSNENGGSTTRNVTNGRNGNRSEVTAIPSTSRFQNTNNASVQAEALYPNNTPPTDQNPAGNTGAIKRNRRYGKKINSARPEDSRSSSKPNNMNTQHLFPSDNDVTTHKSNLVRRKTRSRSTTRPAKDGEPTCPTCDCKYLSGRFIYQCSENHSSCAMCKDGALPCGICGGTITDLRNMKLEAHVNQIKRPCVNKNKGCRVMVKSSGIALHLQECAHNVAVCPLKKYAGCAWEGNPFALKAHFDECHPLHRIGEVDKELFLVNFSQESRIIHLVQLGSYTFVVHMKKDDDYLYATVLVYGTKKFASKWIYELHVYNRMAQHRAYKHADVCHPASVDVDTIFEESSCVVIPVSYAKTFINDNENVLSYKFFIKNINC